MIHGHWPLGEGIERILMGIRHLRLKWFVIERQWIEESLDTLAQAVRRLAAIPFALSSKAEFLQMLRINMNIDRLCVAGQAVSALNERQRTFPW